MWTDFSNWESSVVASGAGAKATFTGSGGTILVDQPVTLGSLSFESGNWSLSSQTSPTHGISLTRTGASPSIEVASDTQAEIAVALSGAEGFSKTGNGALIISAINPLAGTVAVADGKLALSGLGQVGTVHLSSASSTFDLSAISGNQLSMTRLTGVQGSSVILGTRMLEVANTNTDTFAGNLSGSQGSLVKSGGGILSLEGVNSYTGTTTVNAGTLDLKSRTALYDGQQDQWTKENITVKSSATLQLSAGGATGFTEQDVGNLIGELTQEVAGNGLQEGSAIGIDTTQVAGGVFTVAANIGDSTGDGGGSIGLNKLGANTLLLTGQNSYSGTTNLQGGTLKLTGTGNVSLSHLSSAEGTTLNLADAEGTIDIRSISAVGDIQLGGRSVTLGAGNGNSSISGNISGTNASLAKVGSGVLTLTGNNAYHGSTSIEAGTVLFAKKSSLHAGNAAQWTKNNLRVEAGATLALGVGGSGQFAAGDVNTLLGNLTTGTGVNGMKAGSNIGFDTSNAAGGEFTLSTPIADRTGDGAGSLGLVKMGSGTLVMNGTHTYTGATTIQEGTLRLVSSNALSSQSALNLAGANAILDMSGYFGRTQSLGSLSGVAGSRVMLASSSSSGGLTIGGDQSSSSFAGSIVGYYSSYDRAYYGGNVTKMGVGTLTLSGAQLNGGTFQIADGAVALAGNGSLYWNSTVNLSGANARLDLSGMDASSQTIRSLNGVSGSSVELGAKTLVIGARDPSASNYWYGSSGTHLGNITGEGGNLVKSSHYSNPNWLNEADIQVLGGVNNYTGTTTVNSGTLQFAKQDSLYRNQQENWSKEKITVASGGALALSVGGDGEFTTGNVTTLLNELTTNLNQNGLKAGAHIGFDTTHAQGGNFTISDPIADSTGVGGGSLGLLKLGTNTLTLDGAISYTGATHIRGGTLRYVGQSGLNLTGVFSSEGTTLDLSAVNGDVSIGSVESIGNSYNGAIRASGAIHLGGNDLQIHTVDTYDSISGDISGVGASLTKTGTGFLSLSGNNTYTGATHIAEGELRFDRQSALYGGDALKWNKDHIRVASGATLGLGVGYDDGFTSAQISTLLANLGTNVTSGGLQAGATLSIAQQPYLNGAWIGDGIPFALSSNIADTTGPNGGTLNLSLQSDAYYSAGDRIILSGTNTYTGTTDIDGNVQFAKRNSLYGGDTSKWNRSLISGSGELAFNVGGSGEFTASDIQTIVANVAGTYSNLDYPWSGFYGRLGIDTSSGSANLGNINSNGSFYSFLKRGENTLTIHQSNFEQFYVESGVLRLTGAQSADGYAVDGGTLRLEGAASIPGGSSFSGSGVVDISGLSGSGLTIRHSSGNSWNLGDKTLTVSHNKQGTSDNYYYEDVAYLNNVSGVNGSVVKTGTSTLVLAGNNTYTGITSANGGILVVQGTSVSDLEVNQGGRLLVTGTVQGNAVVNGGRLDVGNPYDDTNQTASGFYGDQVRYNWSDYVGDGTLNGDATVKSGGTLGGHGSITGSVTVEAGGMIAPGTSIGSLSTGSVTFASNSTYKYEVDSSAVLAAGADLLVIQGDLNLDMTKLAFSNVAEVPESFEVGTLFSLLNYTGTWNGGLFVLGSNILENGEQFFAGQNYWRIDYDVEIGGLNFAEDHVVSSSSRFINITATAVPEPSSLLLGAAASLLLLRRKR